MTAGPGESLIEAWRPVSRSMTSENERSENMVFPADVSSLHPCELEIVEPSCLNHTSPSPSTTLTCGCWSLAGFCLFSGVRLLCSGDSSQVGPLQLLAVSSSVSTIKATTCTFQMPHHLPSCTSYPPTHWFNYCLTAVPQPSPLLVHTG